MYNIWEKMRKNIKYQFKKIIYQIDQVNHRQFVFSKFNSIIIFSNEFLIWCLYNELKPLIIFQINKKKHNRDILDKVIKK